MKKLFKKLAGLMMGLLAVAGLAGFNASKETSVVAKAAGVTITGGETFYLVPNDNWKAASARFAVYFFGDDGNNWVSMQQVSDGSGAYKCDAPSGNWKKLIFCRMNPDKTENSWDNKWDQTGDLEYDGIKNVFHISKDSWDSGYWRPEDCSIPAETNFYLKTNSNWETANARFAMYFYNIFNNKNAWSKMTAVDGIDNLYKCMVPDGEWNKFIFVRMDPSKTEDNWDNKWNQTDSFDFDKNNVYTLGKDEWDKGDGTWSYVPSNNYNIYVLDSHDLAIDNVLNIHLYGDFDNGTTWPGTPLTKIDGTNIYYIEVDASKLYTKAVINNKVSTDNYSKTVDLTIADLSGNECFVFGTENSKTDTTTIYYVDIVSTKSIVAHINNEDITYYGSSTGLKASATGISVVNLTKDGFAFDADATAALTTEQKQAAFEQYISNVDTCTSYDNIAEYNKLAEGLDTSVEINDEDGENNTIKVSIADKLAYMEVYKASKDTEKGTSGINILGNISSSNNIAIILVVGLLGLTAVGAYYFINKRKYAK